jgi:hypothetical protein
VLEVRSVGKQTLKNVLTSCPIAMKDEVVAEIEELQKRAAATAIVLVDRSKERTFKYKRADGTEGTVGQSVVVKTLLEQQGLEGATIKGRLPKRPCNLCGEPFRCRVAWQERCKACLETMRAAKCTLCGRALNARAVIYKQRNGANLCRQCKVDEARASHVRKAEARLAGQMKAVLSVIARSPTTKSAITLETGLFQSRVAKCISRLEHDGVISRSREGATVSYAKVDCH